jgi:thiol-disulfide isomerase/thioredoxin
VLAVLVTLVVAAAVGLLWRARQGRFRRAPVTELPAPLDPAMLSRLGVTLGSQATLLQFSTAFCQPCRATRRVLAQVSEAVPGVTHADVDAEAHLDLVRVLDISSTPTTLILDSSGRVRQRATGTPRLEHVLSAVGAAVEPPRLDGAAR